MWDTGIPLPNPDTLTLSYGFALSGSRFAPSPRGRGGIITIFAIVFVMKCDRFCPLSRRKEAGQ